MKGISIVAALMNSIKNMGERIKCRWCGSRKVIKVQVQRVWEANDRKAEIQEDEGGRLRISDKDER